jgi:hypothetical protein
MRPKPLTVIALSILAIIGAIPSRAQDSASAKAFLVNVYSHYRNNSSGISFYGPHANLYFHSSLLALENTDVKETEPGYAPAIDWDPICGCQDWNGIWDLNIEIHMESPQQAEANVSFAVFDPKDRPGDQTSKLPITLARENGGWRIWDILDESDPKSTISLRKLLENDLTTLHRNSPRGTSP